MSDLYPNDSCIAELDPTEILSRIEKLDSKLRKLAKDKKKHGNKNSKKRGNKKLKQKIKALKLENAQLKYFIFAMQQDTTRQRGTWLQSTFTKCLPNLIDLGAIVLDNRRPHISTKPKRFYLPESSGKQ
jgi:hypothetical protein